jgi:hypothetical protein
MKKVTIITLLVFGLVTVFSGPVVLAAEQASQSKSEKKVERGWNQALKTQVVLAKARVALLKARSELWINKNKEASLRSLESAKMYLNEAYQSADRSTRARIAGLKSQVETSKRAVREKGQQAGSELEYCHFRDSGQSSHLKEGNIHPSRIGSGKGFAT